MSGRVAILIHRAAARRFPFVERRRDGNAPHIQHDLKQVSLAFVAGFRVVDDYIAVVIEANDVGLAGQNEPTAAQVHFTSPAIRCESHVTQT